MMCGLICRALGVWMMVSLVAGISPAEAQRDNESTANLIFQPDAYDGERGASVSAGANVATTGGVLTPQFFLQAQQPFGIRGWQDFAACLALPVSSGGFRLDWVYESLESFRQYRIGLSYAHRLHRNWFAGLGFRFQQMRTTGYPRLSSPGYELSILWKPLPDLAISHSLVAMPGLSNNNVSTHWWPQEFRAACFYRFGKSLLGLATIDLKGREQVQPAICLRYQPVTQLFIRMGMTTGPPGYFLGTGYKMGQFCFEIWVGLHSYLGLYPGLAWRWEKELSPENPDSHN